MSYDKIPHPNFNLRTHEMEIELVLVAMQRAHPLNTWEFFPDGFKHFADLHPKIFKSLKVLPSVAT